MNGCPTRIGVNTVFLLPGRVGGSETYVVDTLRHAIPLQRDVEWVLFTNRENDALFRRCFAAEPNAVFRSLGVRAGNRLARLVSEQTKLPAACRAERVSVLWSPGYTAPLFLAVPQVVSVLDMQYCEFPQDFSWPARWALRVIVPRAARSSKTVLALSAFGRDQIVRYTGVPAERVRVVYLGVDRLFGQRLPAGECAARVRKHVPPGPYVLCVANTHPHKNIPALVRAFSRLPERTDCRLVLVGVPGRGEAEVRDAIGSAGIGDRLLRLSGVPRDDLVALYQAARVFAFPSLYEGFGLPVLEAMAAGVPVVAVRRGPIAEIGGDAIRYTDGSEEDLAAALAQMLAMEAGERGEWTERASRRASGFTWERTARETLACLLNAAGACG